MIETERPAVSGRTSVCITSEIIRVRPRHGSEIVIPRESVSRVWHVRAKKHRIVLWLAGLLGIWTNFHGHWWLTGSHDTMVAIDVDPPATGRVFGIPITSTRVIVSVEDPDRFITDLLA